MREFQKSQENGEGEGSPRLGIYIVISFDQKGAFGYETICCTIAEIMNEEKHGSNFSQEYCCCVDECSELFHTLSCTIMK